MCVCELPIHVNIEQPWPKNGALRIPTCDTFTLITDKHGPLKKFRIKTCYSPWFLMNWPSLYTIRMLSGIKPAPHLLTGLPLSNADI